MELQVSKLEDGLRWAEKEFEATGEVQSVDILIGKLDKLCSALPFANSQMAIAKREFNKAKSKAYNTYITSSIANDVKFSPLILKDYIAAKLDAQQYAYDVAERLSRTIVHLIDAYRTAISALKQERITNDYYQNVIQ